MMEGMMHAHRKPPLFCLILFLVVLLAPLSAKDYAKDLAKIEEEVSSGKKITTVMKHYEAWENDRQIEIEYLRKKSGDLFDKKKFDQAKEIDADLALLEGLSLSPSCIGKWIDLVIAQYPAENDQKQQLVWLSQKSGWKPAWHYRDPVTKEVKTGGTFLPFQKIMLTVPDLPDFVDKWKRSDGSYVRSLLSFVPDIREREVLEPVYALSLSFTSGYQDVPNPDTVVWTEKDDTPLFPTLKDIGRRRFLCWVDRRGKEFNAGEYVPFMKGTYRAEWAAPQFIDLVVLDASGDGQVEPGEQVTLCPVLRNDGIEDRGRYQVSVASSSTRITLDRQALEFGKLSDGYGTRSASFSRLEEVTCTEADGLHASVKKETPVGSSIPLLVVVTDDRGLSWRYETKMEVKGAREMVTISSFIVREDDSPSYANRDGALNAGERGWLSFTVHNEGRETSLPSTVSFSSSSPFLKLSGNVFSVSSIESNYYLGAAGKRYGDEGSALSARTREKVEALSLEVDRNAVPSTIPVIATFRDERHVWTQTLSVPIAVNDALPQILLTPVRPVGKSYFSTDGTLQKGVRYELVPLVSNSGNTPLASCSMSLRSGTEGVATRGNSAVASVSSGHYAVLDKPYENINDALDALRVLPVGSSPLTFSVGPNVEVGSSCLLVLTVKDTYGNVWENPISFTVDASEAEPVILYYTASSTRTTAKGNSGVTFFIDAVLENGGSSPLMPCTVSLLSEDKDIVCSDRRIQVLKMTNPGELFFLSSPTPRKEDQSRWKTLANSSAGLSFTVSRPVSSGDVFHLAFAVNEAGGKRFVVPFEIVRR